jgi:nicotinamide-nucleotide amidase
MTGNSLLHERAKRLIRHARRNGLTLLTVESCTAGALANVLAAAPGAGEAFDGGFVVYSKQNKIVSIGVPAEVIGEHTAVSAAVVKCMAQGGLDRSPADMALAITGVAGPEPDEDGNPVGLVFIAAARRHGQTMEQKLSLDGSKEEICEAAMLAAIELGEQLLRA